MTTLDKLHQFALQDPEGFRVLLEAAEVCQPWRHSGDNPNYGMWWLSSIAGHLKGHVAIEPTTRYAPPRCDASYAITGDEEMVERQFPWGTSVEEMQIWVEGELGKLGVMCREVDAPHGDDTSLFLTSYMRHYPQEVYAAMKAWRICLPWTPFQRHDLDPKDETGFMLLWDLTQESMGMLFSANHEGIYQEDWDGKMQWIAQVRKEAPAEDEYIYHERVFPLSTPIPRMKTWVEEHLRLRGFTLRPQTEEYTDVHA